MKALLSYSLCVLTIFSKAIFASGYSMDTVESFIKDFIPKVSEKALQLNQARWILETTGSSDAQSLVASLDTEIRLLFSDKAIYKQLLLWQKQKIGDPVLCRQVDVLVLCFK